MAFLASVEPKAVVASPAGSAAGLVAEISKDKGAPATGGVRVFLHGIELCEIGATPPIDRRPVDLERRQRRLWVREPSAAADALPGEELGHVLLEPHTRRLRRGHGPVNAVVR